MNQKQKILNNKNIPTSKPCQKQGFVIVYDHEF